MALRRSSCTSGWTTSAPPRRNHWFASEPAIEIRCSFNPSLGRCAGPVPGGLIDVERSAPEGPAAVARGEVAGVLGGELAAALAGRCGPQVGRGCLDGDQ